MEKKFKTISQVFLKPHESFQVFAALEAGCRVTVEREIIEKPYAERLVEAAKAFKDTKRVAQEVLFTETRFAVAYIAAYRECSDARTALLQLALRGE